MASYIYSRPQNSHLQQQDQRVVMSSHFASSSKRGGRYVGGSEQPLVEVLPRIKRSSK
jgi:hypothetical protein